MSLFIIQYKPPCFMRKLFIIIKPSSDLSMLFTAFSQNTLSHPQNFSKNRLRGDFIAVLSFVYCVY